MTMDVYIYQAALVCKECGDIIKQELAKDSKAPCDIDDESSYDSDDYPKGPYGNGGGEADCPQHCDACNVFLENPLTDDGYKYVKEQMTYWFKHDCVQEWARFYNIEA